ncbi:hypothetical protein F4703DRAFT_1859396 [Phycomyces blakesleeanus]
MTFRVGTKSTKNTNMYTVTYTSNSLGIKLLAAIKLHIRKAIKISIPGYIFISSFVTVCFSKIIPLRKNNVVKIKKEFPKPSTSNKIKSWHSK